MIVKNKIKKTISAMIILFFVCFSHYFIVFIKQRSRLLGNI